MIVFNKPAGLAVQGGSGLTNAMSTRCSRRSATHKDRKPRLVHRLDRETSGVLVVAQTRLAAAALAAVLPRPLDQEDLLGTGHGRAEAEAGPGLDLARQGARGRRATG